MVCTSHDLSVISNASALLLGDPATVPIKVDAEVLRLLNRSSAIYSDLAFHQQTESWSWRDLSAVLHAFAEHLNVEFKLDIPEISLCLDRLDCHRYGHFRFGHNGFGLKGEIALNSRFLIGNRPFWKVLGTLLHEMLHAWQQAHGTPAKGNHHNAEFRAKARELGLVVDENGVTEYAVQSPFKDVLTTLGIDMSDEDSPASASPLRGKSKLKKWTCGCTIVRVAIADFRAVCLKCEREFTSEGDEVSFRHQRAAK